MVFVRQCGGPIFRAIGPMCCPLHAFGHTFFVNTVDAGDGWQFSIDIISGLGVRQTFMNWQCYSTRQMALDEGRKKILQMVRRVNELHRLCRRD